MDSFLLSWVDFLKTGIYWIYLLNLFNAVDFLIDVRLCNWEPRNFNPIANGHYIDPSRFRKSNGLTLVFISFVVGELSWFTGVAILIIRLEKQQDTWPNPQTP